MFTKKLTLAGVVAPLTKVASDLQALKEQNDADVTTKQAKISTLQEEVEGHKKESASADTILGNINALLSSPKS